MVDPDTIINADGSINWEDRTYTPAELDVIATAFLRHDIRNNDGSIRGDNPILFEEHLKNRHKREIYTIHGTPDPAFGHGIYNRTHPEGRKVNSPEQRKRNGASYYRRYSTHCNLSIADYINGRDRLGLDDEETTFRRKQW